jgi:hypothetical protein
VISWMEAGQRELLAVRFSDASIPSLNMVCAVPGALLVFTLTRH